MSSSHSSVSQEIVDGFHSLERWVNQGRTDRLNELAELLFITAASLANFGCVVPFLPALKKPQTTQGRAEGS